MLARLLFPAYSAVQDSPATVGDLFTRSVRLTALLVLPVSALIASLADVIVPVLLGENWLAAIPLVAYVGYNYRWHYAKIVRFLAKLAVPLCVAAVIFSLSRGGLLGSLAMFSFFLLATGRIGKRLLLGVVVAGVVAVALPSLGFMTQRMETIDMNLDEQTEEGRQC